MTRTAPIVILMCGALGPERDEMDVEEERQRQTKASNGDQPGISRSGRNCTCARRSTAYAIRFRAVRQWQREGLTGNPVTASSGGDAKGTGVLRRPFYGSPPSPRQEVTLFMGEPVVASGKSICLNLQGIAYRAVHCR